jgi:hypothetical protein
MYSEAGLWIRKDPHHFDNLDPHPHQIKIQIRIRIKIYKLHPEANPDPHQFADNKRKCMKYEPIFALFHGFEPFFKLGPLDPDPHQGEKSDPDPHQDPQQIKNQNPDNHQGDKSNPDPHQIKNQNPDPHPNSHQGDRSNPNPHQREADPEHCSEESRCGGT